MAQKNRWIDEAWWRDWVFWVGVVLAATGLVVAIVWGNKAWYELVTSMMVSFGFALAVLGFIRTVVRTYRAG